MEKTKSVPLELMTSSGPSVSTTPSFQQFLRQSRTHPINGTVVVCVCVCVVYKYVSGVCLCLSVCLSVCLWCISKHAVCISVYITMLK